MIFLTILTTFVTFAFAEENGTENDTVVRASPRIINGDDSNGYPWLAAIWAANSGVHCGGAMIHDEWVLTAAHCVIGDTGSFDELIDMEDIVGNEQFVDKTIIFDGDIGGPMNVKVGLIDQQDSWADHIVNRQIRSAHCHRDYTKYSNEALDSDICLLRLEEPVTENETGDHPLSYMHHRHLCLPQRSTPSSNCRIAGWGFTEPFGNEKSDVLQEASVPHVSYEQCAEWYAGDGINIQENIHLCYGYENGGTDSCQGDSGGPLMCPSETVLGRWEAQGIVSFAVECATARKPGIYTNVKTFNSWIESTINRVNPEANFTTTCSAVDIVSSLTLLLTTLLIMV